MKKRNIALAISMAMAGLALPAFAAGQIVISQVYGGGGNSGATLRNDYIELFNRGDATVTLDGWSVQYASAAGTTWAKTPLTGSLQSGQYYLVQQAQGAGGSQALPTPDAIGTLALSGTAGKVAVVSNNVALACGASCALTGNVVDFVGFGSANNAEGASAPAPSNTLAILRAAGGCTDSSNNSADFSTGFPVPRNSASAFTVCTDTGGGQNPGPQVARIRDIQGNAHLSPLKGVSVSKVPGVVTVLMGNGFFMQDTQPDSDPATSEGIFVYTVGAPTVAVGDAVEVAGLVAEYRSGGASGASNLTTTEITAPSISVLSSGNALPAPIIIGQGGRMPPTGAIHTGNGDVETLGSLNVSANALDFYESLEGMRVQIDAPVTVGPTNGGELVVIPDAGAWSTVRTGRGGVVIRASDYNPERVVVARGTATPPSANVGDTFSRIVGVFDYASGNYKLMATEISGYLDQGLQAETTRAQTTNELAVGSFNLENLAANDAQSKFDGLARQIVSRLSAPDIIGVMEVQDNDGATSSGTVDATQTIAKLVQTIQQLGGPQYLFVAINPQDGQDGGEPGGNIRQGFLYNPARVSFAGTSGGSATNPVSVLNNAGTPALSFNPGRIDPTNTVFSNSRKPLVAEFGFNGQKLFLIANHLNAKTTDQPLFGRFQPPLLSTEVKRIQQADVVAGFVSTLLSVDPQAKVVVLGDMNDFEFSSTIAKFKGAGLADLVETLPASERYTYVYTGNSQALDHILVSSSLVNKAEYDVVHVNSEFANQNSDHEPEVVRLSLPVLANLSGSFSWSASGLSYNRASGLYQGTVTLTAKSTVTGPLALALGALPGGVSLANSTVTVAGLPAIKLPGSLAAGASVTVPVQFKNTGSAKIGYSVYVYGGI
ncbi:lamin tail domain-containing protein [Chitinimonas naiadis]